MEISDVDHSPKICPTVWTTSLREKVGGLEALQDRDEGPLAI